MTLKGRNLDLSSLYICWATPEKLRSEHVLNNKLAVHTVV